VTLAVARVWPWVSALLVALALGLGAGDASGHEFDSASLSLTEVAPGRFRVDWRASSRALTEELAAPAVFPAPCRLDGGFLECGAAGLAGPMAFPWLEGTRTRVVVDVTFRDGGRLLRVATPSAPALNVYAIPASSGLRSLRPIARDYVWLGVEHILTGLDHLFFVIALTLLARSTAALVGTVTAFTLAHSLSLLATVLGFAAPPAPPVEASIALSIVFVCAEGVRSRESVAQRAPGVVAFVFGLLHGFGFASALLEVGLPENHLPVALFSFNVGVELGQLGVVAVAGALRSLAGRLRLSETWRRRAPLTVMGSAAAYWFLERIGDVVRAG
jgi:hydrogenase/urease accessory protein HupE